MFDPWGRILDVRFPSNLYLTVFNKDGLPGKFTIQYKYEDRDPSDGNLASQ